MIPAGALAQEADLLKCRRIEQPMQRLACYDGLTPPIPQAGLAPTPTPAPVRAAERFGLARAESEESKAIESHIPGRFDGWEPKTRIRLANGQLWEISDGSSGAYQLVDPRVRIRRGALGAFYLEIEHQSRSPRVKRVQ
ncbi:hypothetical protein BURC_04429 [Burkholderiaceae bacterium]|nr:hypothetical protein BURC_04429 [Burkholderiaceae bacterium]